MNPLPPLGLAPELRAQVLQGDTAVARLRAVRRGLDTSLEHLRVLSKSPIRRWGIRCDHKNRCWEKAWLNDFFENGRVELKVKVDPKQ